MKQLTIGLGADHRGFNLKESLKAQSFFESSQITWEDFGSFTKDRSDYPLFAQKVSTAFIEKKIDLGILLCGTGIGMAIAANRYQGVRAGVVWNTEIARRAKEEDNITLLVLPADYITAQEAIDLVSAWLSADFKGGRYQERILLLDNHR